MGSHLRPLRIAIPYEKKKKIVGEDAEKRQLCTVLMGM